MKKYRITLKHDRGEAKITTVAKSIQDAIKKILTVENAPEEAIVKIEIINL